MFDSTFSRLSASITNTVTSFQVQTAMLAHPPPAHPTGHLPVGEFCYIFKIFSVTLLLSCPQTYSLSKAKKENTKFHWILVESRYDCSFFLICLFI